ncbi:SET domain-containing protein 4 [Tupaia chinensis]|uniref:SET domain-containing protein 4 n=1 Tax=Tupaia chinensis TaxID=246437 RepID=L9KZD3_TUPCH|nr:SET domain-containing protein 4 [Tupaia chinensis]
MRAGGGCPKPKEAAPRVIEDSRRWGWTRAGLKGSASLPFHPLQLAFTWGRCYAFSWALGPPTAAAIFKTLARTQVSQKFFRVGASRRLVNESYKSEFIELKKWLKDRKFEDTKLMPACFPDAVDNVFSYSALLWAWCTVNTRAVYLRHRQRECLSAEPDTYALAPYLDLLNHSPNVQVKAAFNEETRCYEIQAASNYRKYEEVFICYGPHDNQRLLLEYGFVSTHNPHACVYVSAGYPNERGKSDFDKPANFGGNVVDGGAKDSQGIC